MARLILLRHAQSHRHVSLPAKDWPLSALGIQQAELLVPVFEREKIDGIYSSPYQRCIDTAAPLASRLGLEVQSVDALRECHLTQGFVEDFQTLWEQSWADFNFCLQDGETCSSGQKRAVDYLERLASTQQGKTIVVSTHGNLISLILNRLDPSFDARHARELHNPDLFFLTWHQGMLNWDKSLDGRKLLSHFSRHNSETPPQNNR